MSFVPAGITQEETMSIIISAGTPSPAANTASPRPASDTSQATAKTAPAATVEISSGARQAYATGPGHTAQHKVRPLNIIWGDSPH